MLAGAIQQYLKAQGLSPVYVAGFGDYTTVGVPAVAVHAEPGADAELDGGAYEARVQLRTRAANQPAAEEMGRSAFDRLMAADGRVLTWTSPVGGPSRNYRLEAIRALQRPTWYPTPEPGEETSCNFRMLVTEEL